MRIPASEWKKVKGVRDVLAGEERLASLIADSISPTLIPSVEAMPWRKTHILAVEVYPSPNRPHYLNRLGPAEGVFVRVGSTNRRADSILIDEMRRYNQVSSFDERPMPDLNSEAIDFRVASEFFKPIRRLTLHGLQSLKVTTSYQGRVVPTTGGVLLFTLTGSTISRTHGYRLRGLEAHTGAGFWIPPKCALIFLEPRRRRSRFFGST